MQVDNITVNFILCPVHREDLPFWYLSNRIMGKLPEYNRTNNEQREVNTKIPDF